MPLDVVNNTVPAKKYNSFANWTRIHVQVRDASTIYLSADRKSLEVLGPGQIQGGLAITQASGVVSLVWKGDLFIMGSNPQSLYDIETFDE
jgi:hypothetical protein